MNQFDINQVINKIELLNYKVYTIKAEGPCQWKSTVVTRYCIWNKQNQTYISLPKYNPKTFGAIGGIIGYKLKDFIRLSKKLPKLMPLL